MKTKVFISPKCTTLQTYTHMQKHRDESMRTPKKTRQQENNSLNDSK